ncbi:MAG TPA: hypothetical protein VNI84_14840 [Pyrinomonadaceae bacterium]|nr:hypothetical protein [Pyrinomonadaceae bacterium]
MNKISEKEFARLCEGIYRDRESIYKHNPIGSPQEAILWMLTCCLISYLSLSEIETPCFNGKPNAKTYENAILFVLENRKTENFEAEIYLKKLLADAEKL